MAYKKIEEYDESVTSGLIKSYRQILEQLGENPERILKGRGCRKPPSVSRKPCNILRRVTIWMQRPC
jgi:hypothetical protein